mgnify:FL=1|jgi:hypothetical protein|tara:strand:+ start:2252 stop:2758 length:507 start_codon:yes stop_codon:yes gene_type:complete
MIRMRRLYAARAAVAAMFAMFLVVACSEKQPVPGQQSGVNIIKMEVFKTPTCGCCNKWVDHLKNEGFAVITKDRVSLDAIKEGYNIDPHYQSCHTGVVDGYVFEGHIPARLIRQFLDDIPEGALGLAVPGMPIGSPGMEMGERFDSYDVLLLKSDGTSEVFSHVDGPE